MGAIGTIGAIFPQAPMSAAATLGLQSRLDASAHGPGAHPNLNAPSSRGRNMVRLAPSCRRPGSLGLDVPNIPNGRL